MRGRLRNQLKDTRILVDAVIAERDQIRPIMTGITALRRCPRPCHPRRLRDVRPDIQRDPGPAQTLGNVPVAPDAATLLEGDLGELIAGLQDTVTDIAGDEGLVGQLLRRLAGGARR